MALLEDVKDKIKYFEADLTDVFGLEDAFEGITHVIHCGALVSFDSQGQKCLSEQTLKEQLIWSTWQLKTISKN
ncbi:MAG: hypothetical protein IPO33_08350 [Saprospiraceae bacterium]|nr:hypothetical protein [Candidatus Brachybacter algidus]